MQNFILFGSVVNFITVIVGGVLGALLRKIKISDTIRSAVMTAMALCVAYIGIDGMLSFKYPEAGINVILCIVSMALGVLVGELLDIDGAMKRVGDFAQSKLGKGERGFSEGMVSCTVIFTVGAMAIVGSIDSGISLDHDTILAKAIIDGITCFLMATTFGIGCAMAALPTFLYQSAITVLAWAAGSGMESLMAGQLFGRVLNEMSLCGSLVIFAIGMNMLGVTKIRVANFLPALFLPILFEILLSLIS